MKFRKGFVSAFVLIVFFSADLYGQDCVSPKEALPDIMQESGDLKVFSGVSPEEAEVAAQRVFWLLWCCAYAHITGLFFRKVRFS